MKTASIVLVSAFGRGQSLAARLKDMDLSVTLLDVSEALGASAPEDEEGPFGFFMSGLPKRVEERMHQDDPPHNQERGWTLMLPDGPLEMKSPWAKNRMDRLGVPEKVMETFRELREGRIGNLSTWFSAGFDAAWLLELSSSLAANSFFSFPQAIANGHPLPLDGDFWIRSVTRPGLLQSLAWCRRQGVDVQQTSIVTDLARESRSLLKSLQVRPKSSATTELLDFEQLIWCLTGEETAFLSEELAAKLFPSGWLKPKWVWTRFRLRMGASIERAALPAHSVWLRSPELPWAHENLLVLQKSLSPDLLDAWIRIPAEQRLQKAYLNERFDQVLEMLAKRFVTVKPVKAEEPLSGERTYREVGPPRQPLFDARELVAWRGPVERNVRLHAPEAWPGLGWNAVFRAEEKILAEIEAWKKKRDKKMKQLPEGRELE